MGMWNELRRRIGEVLQALDRAVDEVVSPHREEELVPVRVPVTNGGTEADRAPRRRRRR